MSKVAEFNQEYSEATAADVHEHLSNVIQENTLSGDVDDILVELLLLYTCLYFVKAHIARHETNQDIKDWIVSSSQDLFQRSAYPRRYDPNNYSEAAHLYGLFKEKSSTAPIIRASYFNALKNCYEGDSPNPDTLIPVLHEIYRKHSPSGTGLALLVKRCLDISTDTPIDTLYQMNADLIEIAKSACPYSVSIIQDARLMDLRKNVTPAGDLLYGVRDLFRGIYSLIGAIIMGIFLWAILRAVLDAFNGNSDED